MVTMIKTFKVDDHYVVSSDDVWVPGIYETRAAAARAVVNLSDVDILAFLEHIYSATGENRPITLDDVETTIAAVKLAEMDRKE